MLLFAFIFMFSLSAHKKRAIKVAKMKIIEAQKLKKEGKTIPPFIEINSSPWYVLAELPGISIDMARHAVEMRKQNGPYPSINVFIHETNVKHVYIEHIKTVAYVKNEVEPIPAPQPVQENNENQD